MTVRHLPLCVIATSACILAAPQSTHAIGGEEPLTAVATQGEISDLIRELGNPSYEKRTYATRRLCAIGAPARVQLQVVAEGNDAEITLRAKAVLAVLDRLMFSGVELTLSASQAQLAWDESIDLSLKMTNRSKYPARVPFALDPAGRSAVEENARQVGDMLDVAEWLQVRGPGGRQIDLTVDDIADDPAVVDAVQQRLNAGPLEVLSPGRSVTLTARAFNRGWARYRLLDEGAYTVVMEYIPRWDDEMLSAQRVGRVVSNHFALSVTKGAPDAISRSGVEASLVLEKPERLFVARLTNRTDRALVVNKNFGMSPPFAEAHWVFELGGVRGTVPVRSEPRASASPGDFDPALLVALDPGQSIDLARIERHELSRRAREADAPVGAVGASFHFAYMNLCNRQWQKRQMPAPPADPELRGPLQHPLPPRILVGRFSSNHVRTTGPHE